MAAKDVPTPGSIRVTEVSLLARNATNFSTKDSKKTIDLLTQGYVGDITIKESMHTNYLTCDISIGDARNLLGNLPILGGEAITIKMCSSHLNDQNPTHVIEQSFIIHSISNRVFKDDREQMYNLHCISPEGYKNNTVVISERFSGPPKEIFNDIYQRFLSEPRTMRETGSKDLKRELEFCDVAGGQTFKKDNICFIANYWTPYECMNYLASKAAPSPAGGKELMPNVKYFQTHKAHYVASLSKIAAFYKEQGLIYDEFTLLPQQYDTFMLNEDRKNRSGYKSISPFASNKHTQISKLAIPFYTDDLNDQISGYQGNFTVGFDMTTRLPYHMEFDYTSAHEQRLKDNQRVIPAGYKDFFHIDKTSPIKPDLLTNPRSAMNVQMGSSQMWTDNDFGHDWRFLLDTAYRDTATAELERLELSIDIPGRTDIEVGQLVWLNIPNTGEKGDNPSPDELFDKKMTGLYSITRIRHDIDIASSNHEMSIDVVRDSLGADT